jgi:hypothetical protein
LLLLVYFPFTEVVRKSWREVTRKVVETAVLWTQKQLPAAKRRLPKAQATTPSKVVELEEGGESI